MADFRGGPTVENFQKKMLLKVDFLDRLDNSEQKKIVLEVDFQKNVSMRHCIPDLRTALNVSILIFSENPEKSHARFR